MTRVAVSAGSAVMAAVALTPSRHADVHQDDLGMFTPDYCKRRVPVARCADHGDLGI